MRNGTNYNEPPHKKAERRDTWPLQQPPREGTDKQHKARRSVPGTPSKHCLVSKRTCWPSLAVLLKAVWTQARLFSCQLRFSNDRLLLVSSSIVMNRLAPGQNTPTHAIKVHQWVATVNVSPPRVSRSAWVRPLLILTHCELRAIASSFGGVSTHHYCLCRKTGPDPRNPIMYRYAKSHFGCVNSSTTAISSGVRP